MMRLPLRRLLVLLLLALSASACDGGGGGAGTGPEPEPKPEPLRPEDVAGTYALVTINGSPLPAFFYYDSHKDRHYDTVAGSILLRQDGTYFRSETVQWVGTESKTDYTSSGTYRLTADSAFFSRTGGVGENGVYLSNDTITGYTWATQNGVYLKQ